MVSCSKCYGNEIEAKVWIDLTTNEVVDRCDEYHCRHCGAQVEIIITPDIDWIVDVEPLKEENEKEKEDTQIIPTDRSKPTTQYLYLDDD